VRERDGCVCVRERDVEKEREMCERERQMCERERDRFLRERDRCVRERQVSERHVSLSQPDGMLQVCCRCVAGVLPCVDVCCSVRLTGMLQCVASVLQCVAVGCRCVAGVLQRVAVRCNVLQCIAVCYVLQDTLSYRVSLRLTSIFLVSFAKEPYKRDHIVTFYDCLSTTDRYLLLRWIGAYGVVTIGRLLKNSGLFCKRAL